jgi:hypothetical protein
MRLATKRGMHDRLSIRHPVFASGHPGAGECRFS